MMVNPLIWYAERELDFVPRHFVKCPTPLNYASKQWVQNKVSGRFAFAPTDKHLSGLSSVFFEDEKDATIYELLWASSSV